MGIFSFLEKRQSKQSVEKSSNFKNAISLSDQLAVNPHWSNSGMNAGFKKQTPVAQNDSNKKKSNRNNTGRKNQPLGFFIIHILIAIGISFQNIFIVYGGVSQNYDKGIRIISIDLFFIVCFSFINSIYLVPLKTVFLMYTLLDGVLVAQIAALVGLVGSLLLVQTLTKADFTLMIMIPISFFFFVGNFRVCIRFADWNSAQIILYKLAIMAGAVCFFEIGAYYLAVNFSYTQGMLEELDSKLKDFITLYAFGTFEFFRQLFAKICDFDQTAEFKYTYKFKKENDDSFELPNQQIQMMEIQKI